MSKHIANFLMILSLALFLIPLAEIFSVWIIDSKIFLPEELHSTALLSAFGLVLVLISLFLGPEKRKIYILAFLSLLPGYVSVYILIGVAIGHDISTQAIIISLILIMVTALLVLIMHRLGLIPKYVAEIEHLDP